VHHQFFTRVCPWCHGC